MSRDKLFKTLDVLQGRKQDQRRVINAVLGMGNTAQTVEVSSRPGYHWVRLYGDLNHVVPALNRTTAAVHGLPVQVAVSTDFRTGRREYEVVGLADNEILTSGGTIPFEPYLPEHASSHSWSAIKRGRDPVSVYPRAFAFGRVYPTTPVSMRCMVSPIQYIHQTTLKTFSGGQTKDFTSDVPSSAAKARLVLVVLDGTTNALDYVNGDEFTWTAWTDEVPPSAVPQPEQGQLVLSCIILYTGLSSIVEKNFYYEYRLPFATIAVANRLEDLEDVGDGTPTEGHVLMGDGTQWQSVLPAAPLVHCETLYGAYGEILIDNFGEVIEIDLNDGFGGSI